MYLTFLLAKDSGGVLFNLFEESIPEVIDG
jgi:hypothetical protein